MRKHVYDVTEMAASTVIFAIVLLCSGLQSVASDILTNHHSKMVQTVKYQVDLDRPPKERWLPILEDFTSSVPLMLEYYHSIVRLYAYRWH